MYLQAIAYFLFLGLFFIKSFLFSSLYFQWKYLSLILPSNSISVVHACPGVSDSLQPHGL